MANPAKDKQENSPEEEHPQDVSSEQEKLNIITPPTPSSPSPTPTIQGGKSSAKSDGGGIVRGDGASESTSKKVATSREKIVEKKRGRNRRCLDPGASSSSRTPKDPKKSREKWQIVNVPSGPPRCYFCGKVYKSWKAVFGHMGKHKVGKERERGVFPPPNFIPPRRYWKRVFGSGSTGGGYASRQDALQEELAPTLLNLAQQVLVSSSSSPSSSASRPDGLMIDLNQPADPHSLHKEEGRFDLNKPPEEEEEGDDGENMDGDFLSK